MAGRLTAAASHLGRSHGGVVARNGRSGRGFRVFLASTRSLNARQVPRQPPSGNGSRGKSRQVKASRDSGGAPAQLPIATFVAAAFAVFAGDSISFCSMIFVISASACSPYCAKPIGAIGRVHRRGELRAGVDHHRQPNALRMRLPAPSGRA